MIMNQWKTVYDHEPVEESRATIVNRWKTVYDHKPVEESL